MSTEKTTVETVDMDLSDILGTGADSVMVPAADDKKPGLFTRKTEDLSYLNDEIKKDDDGIDEIVPPIDKAGSATPPVTNDVIDTIVTETDEQKAAGRPRLDKDGLVEFTNKLIEKKILIPFDDGKPISDYTVKDFEELFEANVQEKERKIREQVPSEFFNALPPEMQYAAKYIADGGQDLKGLFRTLAAVEEVKSLDPSAENDQRHIVRSYLQATNFGTPEEIEEEINSWDDRGELAAKASKFKPKLDAMSERQIQYQIQQQEQMRLQQEEQARFYTDSVYKTLEPAEINGLKLDKRTQNMLFAGLVQPNYQSVSGKQTNLLGHLLEKHQFIEPNHGLIAEALWLLADPDGYRARVRETTKKEVVEETVRKLKTEERNKLASNSNDDEANTTSRKPAGIPRPTQSFFKR